MTEENEKFIGKKALLNKIKTINKVPILIILFVMCVFSAITIYYIFKDDKASKNNIAAQTQNRVVTETSQIPDALTQITNSQSAGIVKPQSSNHLENQPENTLAELTANANNNGKYELKPIAKNNNNIVTHVDNKLLLIDDKEGEIQRIRMAPITVYNYTIMETDKNAKENYDETQKSTELQNIANNLVDNLKNMNPNNTTLTASSSLAMFDNKQNVDRWSLNNHIQKQKSKFQINTGDIIPAILITPINSELRGQVMAQVSRDVYDSITGNYLLIPQGTKLIGNYDNKVIFGQSRLLVAWQRLILPNGDSLDIGAMSGYGMDGMNGFKDSVNNHYMKIFGSAAAMSLISAGLTAFVKPQSLSEIQGLQNTLQQSLGNQLAQTVLQLLNRNLSIAPTLEIRAGFKFNVQVMKDLVFDKAFTVN